MRFASSALALICIAGLTSCGNQSPANSASASERLEQDAIERAKIAETNRLNVWFEAKYNEAISRSPMTATFLGSRENYDKWNDVTEASQRRELEIQRANVAEMRDQFDPENLTAQGQ